MDYVVEDRGYNTGEFSVGFNNIFIASVIQRLDLRKCFYDIMGN